MSKVYYTNLKTYTLTLGTLLLDIFNDSDLLYSDQAIRLQNNVKIKGYV